MNNQLSDLDKMVIYFLDHTKNVTIKQLRINDRTIYHVQDYLRSIYKSNRFLNRSRTYQEYIRYIITPGSLKEEYENILYSDSDFDLSRSLRPKIFI